DVERCAGLLSRCAAATARTHGQYVEITARRVPGWRFVGRRSRSATIPLPRLAHALDLDVEPEQEDIAVLHDVILALRADEPLFARGFLRAFPLEVGERERFGADESALEVGVDLAGGLGRA